MSNGMRWLAPALAVAIFLAAWEGAVRAFHVPAYLVPAPTVIAQALAAHADTLLPEWIVTIRTTLEALVLAVLGGVAVAVAFALSRTAERALAPFIVVLQVTPVIAIAPLLMVLTDNPHLTILGCAWIVALFPVMANTLVGLRSTDPQLRDLFRLHRASRLQTLRLLLVPSALPYFLAGLRTSSGLALVGGVVGEFTAGAAGRNSGLASRILESMFRTEIPTMFAALVLVTVTGVALYLATLGLSRWLLGRWHDSEQA